MLACRRLVVSFDAVLPWLVSRPQTRSFVHAEAAQQGVARSDLHHLGRAQQRDHRGAFLADAEAVEGLFAVRPDQALGQHQVGQVGFTDFGEDLVGVHVGFLRRQVFRTCLALGLCLNVERIVKFGEATQHQGSSVA